MTSTRLIMYHKQSTSARTRFLRLAHGGICAFEPLPASARVVGATEVASEDVARHPAMSMSEAEQTLGLERGALELEPGFRVRVEVPGDRIDVFLVRFTAIDPPFELAESRGDGFFDLTEMRGVPPADLQLLRLAYERILG